MPPYHDQASYQDSLHEIERKINMKEGILTLNKKVMEKEKDKDNSDKLFSR